MVRVIRALLIAVFCGIALPAIAAPIPTPAPGSGVPIAAPTPTNPVQYVVAPGQIGSAAGYNSNNFKIYSDMLAIANALNGCNYIPGAAIGTITAVSPLNVAFSTCSSGTGNGATATISLGGIVPSANLPANIAYLNNAATFSTGTFSGPITAASNGSTVSYVPAFYTQTGGAVGPAMHGVVGTVTLNPSTSTGVGFSGAAVFSTTSSYSCSFSATVANSTTAVVPSNIAASQVNFYNPAGVAIAGTFKCEGY